MERSAALSKLNEYVDKSRAGAEATVRQILEQVPNDRVVPAGKLEFAADSRMAVRYDHPIDGPQWTSLHHHALIQAASRMEVPTSYADDLNGSEWGRQLLVRNLNDNLRHRIGDDPRFLLRAVNGEVRGFLSNRYRRIDSRPILDVLMGQANKVGGIVAWGHAGDVNVALRIIIPEVREAVSGDFVVVGVDFSNSDFGRGAVDLSSFLLRLACINGAMVATDFRKIHLGARLDESMEFSERTYRLDTAAMTSALKDMSERLLSPARLDAMVESVRAANAKTIDPDREVAGIRKRITKAESEALSEKFRSADVVDLPAGTTAWRFSNALSWLARETRQEGRGERALELESLAGEFVQPAAA